MTTKGGPKTRRGHRTQEMLTPYEGVRLRQCMQNKQRLEQLGFACTNLFASSPAIAKGKNKTKDSNREDSGSEYDPLQDDTAEDDLIDDDNAKGSKENTQKKASSQSADLTDAGVKIRSRKRVFAEHTPTRTTRSQSTISQPDASLTINVPNVELPENLEDHPQHAVEDGGVAIPQCDGDSHMANEDGSLQDVDNNTVHGRPDGIINLDGDNQTTNEGEAAPRIRGVNMGHGLERMSRSRRGKLSVVIPEGNIRPLVPLVAAKYATECNIAVRNHVPVLRHWKEYKKQPGFIDIFLGRLRAKFDIDTNDAVVRKGCLEMMKSAVRQQRHKLKEKYFDPFPLHLVPKTSPVKPTSDEQWTALVDLWKTPQKMEACQKNKDNRANVKFHQTTGSRSYPVFVESLGGEFEDEDKEPDAFELFKVCHFSKKRKGYTPTVQSAITEMENLLTAPPTEGQDHTSVAQVVADVLGENSKKPKFLQNVGIVTGRPRSNVEALQVEKIANAELQSIVNSQRTEMEDLSKQLHEAEQTRIRDAEEMKKKYDELEAKLELVLRSKSTT